jgi:lipoprotein-anchoring transpeptidase ErfK/SrfK
VARLPTPTGTFQVQQKIPVKLYQGPGYYLPNTKWNLEFLPGYYIHGAYWHNNFGHPMSHGCVNVSYQNMEALYDWAEFGTQVIIHS